MHHRRLHLRVEERPAGDEVVEDGAERVDVGAAVDRAAVELLRRHVGERADAVDLRHVRAEVEDAAEVADLDVGDRPVGQHREQVGGLDVAVDQPLAVDVAERHRALEADLDDQLERKQLVGAAVRAQRAAGDVLHDQVRRHRVGDGVEDLDDVRVLQPADERRLGGEEALRVVAVDRIAAIGARTRLIATLRRWKSSQPRKTSLVAPSPRRPRTRYLPICAGSAAAPADASAWRGRTAATDIVRQVAAVILASAPPARRAGRAADLA
jgi:hypothetical protein